MALLDEHIDGRYEILEKLKEGGMGAIYKVRHRLLDEVRVVKVIRSAVAGRPDAGDRFLREAQVAVRLRHPNIAALHDYAIAEDGNAFLVMEFIDGSTLQEILDRHGRPPLTLTLEIARQSLRALGYLHRQKIVHRDVAPDNLMLTRDVDGHALVKLIDLGIAKAFEEAAAGQTSTGVFLGKPRYASPEQFGGAGLDARSDLYSFAVVLYELLTDRCPILGSDPPSYTAGHLLHPPVDFTESDPEGRVPPALREVVLRALAKRPEERFTDAEGFALALKMIQDELASPGIADLAVILQPSPVEGKIVPFPVRPGSTQDRLDRQFLLLPEQEVATLPPLGGAAFESARRLNSPPAETSTVTLSYSAAVTPAATSPSVLDNLTWVTAPARETDPLIAPMEVIPVSSPPAPLAGAQEADRSSGWRVALGVGVMLVFLAGGGLWWMRSQRARPEPVVLAPAVVVSPPAVDPATLPPSEPSPTSAEEEEMAPAASAPLAVTQMSPEVKKTILVEDEAVAPAEVPPMQRGDFIRRGMPNVEAPVPLDIPAYSYPEAARGRGREARVRVGVLVDEEGRVIEAVIREGGGSGLGFDEIALETARKAPFQAATRNGIPGKMWTEVILEFVE